MIGRSSGNGHSTACSVVTEDSDPHLCRYKICYCFPLHEIGVLSDI